MSALKLIFLLSCWSFTGVTATDSSMMHYQLQNSSVCLHVKHPAPYRNGQWTFDDKFIADKESIIPSHKDRLFFNHTNLTLCIYGLTKNDTGIFKASYLSNLHQKSEEHQIVVQEMVPTPVITVIPENPYNLSAGLCNFSVNCSIQDEWLWSICDKDNCRISQRSFRKLNITIFTENTSVVCSGNNHVSMNNISEHFSTMCDVKSNLKHNIDLQRAPNILQIAIIMFVLLLCVCLGIAIKCWQANHHQETTSPVQLIQSGPLETQQRVSTSSSEADPSYENVETNQPRENSNPRDEQVFSENQWADTVYSVPGKAASCVKSDQIKDPPGDASVHVNEEQSPTQTETVYSVLQMPKEL